VTEPSRPTPSRPTRSRRSRSVAHAAVDAVAAAAAGVVVLVGSMPTAAALTAVASAAAPSAVALVAGRGDDGLFGVQDATYDGVFRQSIAIGGLEAADVEVPDAAVGWLLRQQCADGSFTSYRPDTANRCAPGGWDSNATAAAVQALVAVGSPAATDAAGRAVTWLRSVQDADGGFAFAAGGATDANSTGLVLAAFAAVGTDPSTVRTDRGDDPLDAIEALQVDCSGDPADVGGLAFQPQEGGELFADTFATSGALLGFAGGAFPDAPGTPGDDVPTPTCPPAGRSVAPTAAPATTAPATTAPPSSAPTTSAPTTSRPPTTSPATTAPPTTAPPTSAPSTTVPTTAPPTTVPTTAPPTTVPTTAPPSGTTPWATGAATTTVTATTTTPSTAPTPTATRKPTGAPGTARVSAVPRTGGDVSRRPSSSATSVGATTRPVLPSVLTTDPVDAARFAGGYLARNMRAGKGFVLYAGAPDIGQTLNAVLGLTRLGIASDEVATTLAALPAALPGWVVDGNGVDRPGSLGDAAMALTAAGADPAAFGGVDYGRRILATLQTAAASTSPTASPSPTSSPTATSTATATPTATGSATPRPIGSTTSPATTAPTGSPTATGSPTVSASRSVSPTATPAPTEPVGVDPTEPSAPPGGTLPRTGSSATVPLAVGGLLLLGLGVALRLSVRRRPR